MCGIRGPSRATELALVKQGCFLAVVGVQLWFLRSNVVGKAEHGNDIDSPSRVMAVGVASQDGGLFSPKSRSKGTSVMVRGSDQGSQKMKRTNIDSPKLDLGEVTEMTILQQH